MAKLARKRIRREDQLVRRLFPADPDHLLNDRPTRYIFMRRNKETKKHEFETECSVYTERLMCRPNEWAITAAKGQARAVLRAEAALRRRHQVNHEPEEQTPSHTVILGLDTLTKCTALARHARADLTLITPIKASD